MDEAGNLSNLREIAIPLEPSSWPAGPGAWIIGILLIALLLQVFLYAWNKWRRNAYRRVALRQLESVDSVYSVSVLLKRVALVAWDREQVASLHGQDWIQFLRSSCPAANLEELITDHPESSATSDLKGSARTWIKHHSRNVNLSQGRDA